ncbi:hypothetical protein ABHF54_02510 [Nitrosomonas europaea]|uniref:hypothetical protein n=1 Tax=Nitrosomonas europaea TaxID=915 RepID=UPI0032658C7B
MEAYEAWGKPVKIDYKALAGEEGWQQHLMHLEEVLSLLEKAESHASALRHKAKAFAAGPK